MCLATVYIENDGQREKLMQDVAWIKPEPRGLQLTTLLGESRLIQAHIESIDLMNSSIILRKMATESASKGTG